MPLPKGKGPGTGPKPNDPGRHQQAVPPTAEGGQKPPTDARPVRQHYQVATEGMEQVK